LRPWLDRAAADPDRLSPRSRAWREEGRVVLSPADLGGDRWLAVCDAYAAVRERADGWEAEATPYMRVPELAALCCDGALAEVLCHLLGEPAGVHLNLCGWETT